MNKISYLLLLLALSLSASVNAQYYTVGPKGGAAFNFYNDAGKIWIASNTGVYSTTDNGISWKISSSPENAFACDNVMAVAASQTELYAATQNLGILHSIDGGATWTNVSNGIKTTGGNYSDVEMAGPNTLAIRPDSGLLYFTTNQGLAWQKYNFAVGNSRAINLSLHNNAVYAVTSAGLFSSVNNGISFTLLNPAVTNGKLAWATDTAYLATSNGILRSLDFGMSFSAAGLSGRNVGNVAASGNYIFANVVAAGQDTVKYSSDGGVSFNNALTNSIFIFKNVQDLCMAGNSLLIGTNYGLFCSRNFGGSWTSCDSGFTSSGVQGLAAIGPIVFAATTPSGIYRTTDSATTWNHDGDYAHGVDGMIQCIDASGTNVYAGDTSRFYHSTDNGLTWTNATGLGTGIVSSIYAVKTTAEVWLIQGGNVYYSLNNGAVFTAVPSIGVPVGRASYITGSDTNIFATAVGGLYHAGASKTFTLTSGLTAPATCVIRNGSTFFAGTNGGGLFSSTDGNIWTHVIPVSPGTLPSKINALAVDSGTLVAGTDDGLYRDKTGTWHQDSLRGKIILSLLINSGHLYVGTCGGVFTEPYPPALPVAITPVSLSNAGMKVYPNPASGSFRVSFAATKDGLADLSILDLNGRVVYSTRARVSVGANTIELSWGGKSQPAPGIYTLRVYCDGKESFRKISLE